MVLHKYRISSYGETKRLLGDSDNLPEPILFREKLYVFDENGKRIGRFSLNIEQDYESDIESNQILYVHISNRAYVNGRLSETTVTGTVTHKLRTLEEIRYECTDAPTSGKHERCLFLLRERTKYYLSVTNTICDVKTQTHMTIPFTGALGLIGECANAVLMRKLARKGHEGILYLTTILSNGKRAHSYYVTKLSERVINGRPMQVLIIYRNITNHKRCNITMTLALTRAGQILYLFWSNSKCFLHVDPDAQIYTHVPSYGESGLHKRWHKDIQLYSLYLDRVDLHLALSRSFILEREELKRLLGDFVEYLLLFKPHDVICFAIQYFSAFGHHTLTTCQSKTTSLPDDEETSHFGEDDRPDHGEALFSTLWAGEGGLFYGP